MADIDFRIPLKLGRNSFPGFIQLNGQLLHAFVPVCRMPKRMSDGDPLSLPFISLQQLLAEISSAIAVFQPAILAAQRILKALLQA